MHQSSRRDFLVRSGAAAASASIPFLASRPCRAADSAPGADMRLGLVTYLWGRDWDLPTLLANCEQAHLGGVELRVEHAHGVSPELNAKQRREVRRRFADSPVENVGMGTNQKFDYVDQNELRKSIEDAKEFIKLSHDVGGTGVKVKPNDLHPDVPAEKTIEQIGISLREIGEFGQGYGQEIRLEVHGNCSKLPIIKAIMDAADHDNVRVCWNCNRQDLDGEGLAHNFKLVRNKFGNTCHIRELNVGDYPYQELVDLLVGTDYGGWVLLECRTDPADRVAAMQEQREIFAKMVRQAQTALAG